MIVDPITLELIRNALQSVVDEMALTLVRTAYSANLSVDMLETNSEANPTFIGGSDRIDTRIVVRGLQASTKLRPRAFPSSRWTVCWKRIGPGPSISTFSQLA